MAFDVPSLDKWHLRFLRLAVEVASWSGAHRIRFPGTQQPWCHHLNETDFHAVRDTYDYSLHE